jgi:flagellar biosynthetic protein FlhB
MADEEDESQKTEEPTRKRLEEATERGQVITSRETTSFFMLLTFTFLIVWIEPSLMRKTQFFLSMFIERPDSLAMDAPALGRLMIDIIKVCGGLLFIPFAATIGATFIANIIQNRFVFSLDPITPSLEKISPFAGLGRLFSLRGITEFIKSIIKIIVVAIVEYYAVAPYFIYLKQMPAIALGGILFYVAAMVKRLLIAICIVMFFISIIDYLYQRYEFLKSMRMTKQEVKDEYKQQEGDPKIKQRLRQIRMERARKRMIAAVPTADVIVTNPTHYSIALKYDDATMRAPKVVAKGADNIALRIREIAKEHDIPVFESPALAQALYATVDIDKEVPAEHYKAVAEVISYVYRLRGKLRPQTR